MNKLIFFKNITIIKKNYKIIDNISFTLPSSGILRISGKNGSGKSTLASVISGDIYYIGKVYDEDNNKLDKRYLSRITTKIDQSNTLNNECSVLENLELTNSTFKEIEELMIRLAFTKDIYDKKVSVLSGGEIQRVMVARSLLQSKQIIIADEILSNLDFENKKIVFKVLEEVSTTKLVVFIEHGDFFKYDFKNEIILMDGRIIKNEYKKDYSLKKLSQSFHYKTDKLQNSYLKNIEKPYFVRFIRKLLPILIIIFILFGFILTTTTVSSNKTKLKFIEKQNVNLTYSTRKTPDTFPLYMGSKINTIQYTNDYEYNVSIPLYFSVLNAQIDENLIGQIPKNNLEVVITDIIADVLIHKNNTLESIIGTKINIYNKDYYISGVFITNYSNAIHKEEISERVLYDLVKRLSLVFFYDDSDFFVKELNNYLLINKDASEIADIVEDIEVFGYYQDFNLINQFILVKNQVIILLSAVILIFLLFLTLNRKSYIKNKLPRFIAYKRSGLSTKQIYQNQMFTDFLLIFVINTFVFIGSLTFLILNIILFNKMIHNIIYINIFSLNIFIGILIISFISYLTIVIVDYIMLYSKDLHDLILINKNNDTKQIQKSKQGDK